MDKNILYVDILNNVKFLKWNYDRRDNIYNLLHADCRN